MRFADLNRVSCSANGYLEISRRCENLKRTETFAPLGEMLTLRVTQPGLVVIAGASRESSMTCVIDTMKGLGADVLFVDGSLSRIAPMTIADTMVFTMGQTETGRSGLWLGK